mmetsp:Transcript_30698/g.57477  ORF Transcript_30698/g.57477 Transcript_30698/m.57477 type:complete len:114 (-) Transcript_30698:582-923(-)
MGCENTTVKSTHFHCQLASSSESSTKSAQLTRALVLLDFGPGSVKSSISSSSAKSAHETRALVAGDRGCGAGVSKALRAGELARELGVLERERLDLGDGLKSSGRDLVLSYTE